MNSTDSGETSEFDDRSYTPILTTSDNEPGLKNLNIFTDKQAQFNVDFKFYFLSTNFSRGLLGFLQSRNLNEHERKYQKR